MPEFIRSGRRDNLSCMSRIRCFKVFLSISAISAWVTTAHLPPLILKSLTQPRDAEPTRILRLDMLPLGGIPGCFRTATSSAAVGRFSPFAFRLTILGDRGRVQRLPLASAASCASAWRGDG